MNKSHSDISPAHSGSTVRDSAIAGHDHGDVDVEKDIPHSDAHGLAKADEADPHAAATAHVDEATLFASPLPITGERKTTTRKELWSWYLYYVGNSGLGPFNFAISGTWAYMLDCGGCADSPGVVR